MIGEPCSFHLYNNLKFEISDISHLLNRGDSGIILNLQTKTAVYGESYLSGPLQSPQDASNDFYVVSINLGKLRYELQRCNYKLHRKPETQCRYS